MTTVSISKFKSNPMAVITNAGDYPIQIQNRSKIAGYFVSKDLFEKMVNFMEDIEDKKAIENADYKNGTTLEDMEKELGLE